MYTRLSHVIVVGCTPSDVLLQSQSRSSSGSFAYTGYYRYVLRLSWGARAYVTWPSLCLPMDPIDPIDRSGHGHGHGRDRGATVQQRVSTPYGQGLMLGWRQVDGMCRIRFVGWKADAFLFPGCVKFLA